MSMLTTDSIIWSGFNPDEINMDLENQGITGISPGTFDLFTNVEQLVLGSNEIAELPANVFDKLPRLRRLSLSKSLLTRINANCFLFNTMLEVLNLSSNQIVDFALPRCLSRLKLLDLKNNQLKSLPSQGFAGLTSLLSLDLSRNQLTTLPELFIAPGNPTALKELFLYNNQLKTLSAKSFANLKNLENLNIGDNQLTELSPEFFAAMPNLKTLNVGWNLLKRLPNPIKLPNLEEAYFDHNPLEEKPQIASTKLRILSVSP